MTKRIAGEAGQSIDVAVDYGIDPAGLPKPADFLRWVQAALASTGKPAEVSIRIVDAAEGHEMNMRYRHKDYATNVLSFRADLPPGVPIPLLGDLVLCAPVIAREAEQQHKPLAEHYAHLTVHGVLHLVGHDHETVAEARAMEAIEIQVLEKIGISDPYTDR